jgi:hypothetical protein
MATGLYIASLSTSCKNAVIFSSWYKECNSQLVELQDGKQVVGTTFDKSVEPNNLVAVVNEH